MISVLFLGVLVIQLDSIIGIKAMIISSDNYNVRKWGLKISIRCGEFICRHKPSATETDSTYRELS